MRTRITILALLLCAAPLAAQEKPQMPGHPMPDHMPMPPMGMGMPMHGAGMLLMHRGSLGLTDDQVARIRDIDEKAMTAARMHMELAMKSQQDAMSAMMSDAFDLKAYETALRAAANHHIEAMLAQARGMADARQVLTAEQRQKMMTGMQMMHEMMMHEMMPHGEDMDHPMPKMDGHQHG